MNLRDVIIVVALAGIVAFLGVQVWNMYAEDAPDYEYLECIPLEDFGDGVTAVSGCAEIVDIGSKRYVKMTDVGSFTVYRGSDAKAYDVGPAKLDLFLQSGQSNAYFFSAPGAWPNGTDVAPTQDGGPSPLDPGTAFYIGTEDGIGQYGGGAPISYRIQDWDVWDMTATDGTVRMANTYPAFLYYYTTATGHRAIMADSAIGGRSITAFEPGGDCYDLTKRVLSKVSEILDSNRFDITPLSVFWLQGENDADMSPDVYKAKIIELTDRFTGGEFGISFPKLITSLPSAYGRTDVIGSAQGQIDAAAEDSRIIVSTSLAVDLPKGLPYYRDNWHYTQEVYNWIGEAFARTMTAGPDTLVICDWEGTEIPPEEVEAKGISGENYIVSVDWDLSGIDGPGTYQISGNIIKIPNGTTVLGLAPEANIALEE